MSSTKVTPCRLAARHWYAYYGWVGSSAPECQHCGEPNPHYRPDDDPWSGTTDFEVGDRALHKNNQLDSREVVAVRGGFIVLRIGTLNSGWVPADNYDRILKEV